MNDWQFYGSFLKCFENLLLFYNVLQGINKIVSLVLLIVNGIRKWNDFSMLGAIRTK